jgi:hypothetical protein
MLDYVTDLEMPMIDAVHRSTHSVSIITALVLACGIAMPATADEGGVPFWFSGQYASFAAVPTTPGWSFPVQGYHYDGSISGSTELPRGNLATAGLNAKASLVLTQPTYAPETKLWGGQLAVGLGFGWGSNTSDADVAISGFTTELNRSDTVTGFTDLYPIASLAWNKGNNNWMTYVTGDIPVGDYDPNRLSNLGIGHGAIDIGGGYTYFNQSSGREFSAVLGFTYNFENYDTNYQNGIDVHLDWAVSQFLNEHWQVGLVGYVYDQVTGDRGPLPVNNGLKSSVAAIGPQVGYAFTVNGQPAYFNIRGYWEFAARNRVEGGALFATLSIPLGNKSK